MHIAQEAIQSEKQIHATRVTLNTEADAHKQILATRVTGRQRE